MRTEPKKTETQVTRMDPGTKRKLERLARDDRQSMALTVRRLVDEEYNRRYKKASPRSQS